MKRLSIILMALMLLVVFAMPAMAETTLQSSVTRTSLDQYRVETLFMDVTNSVIEIGYSLGYDDTGTHIVVERHAVQISNEFIARDRRRILSASEFGTLPAAYQTNPATVILGKINSGDPSPAANVKAYLELVLNALTGL